MRQLRNPVEAPLPASGAMRIYVGGLTDQLADIKENDLRDVITLELNYLSNFSMQISYFLHSEILNL